MVNNNAKKLLYTTINGQTISSDGKYLFCGNNYGDIAAFK
jgi:hypothetical protein